MSLKSLLGRQIRTKKMLWSIFFISLFVRIIFFIAFGNFHDPNMFEHGRIARNIYTGHGFSMYWPYNPVDPARQLLITHPPKYETAFIPPVSPWLIAISFFLFGDNAAAYTFLMIINSIIGAFTPVLVYLIAKKFSSEQAARLSALAAIIFLPAVYSVITFSGSSIYQTLALAVMLFAIKANREDNIWNYLLLGLLCGLQTLLRAEFLALGVIIITFALLYKKTDTGSKLKYAAIALFMVMLLTAPWIYRNSMLFGRFTTIVSHPWHEIWRGNNNLSSGGSRGGDTVGIWIDEKYYLPLVKKLDSMPYNQHMEIAVDSLLREEVIRYSNKDPLHIGFLALKRMFFLWTIDVYTPRAREARYVFFIIITLIPFLLGYARFVKSSRKKNEYFPIVIISTFLIFYTLLIGATNLETRYQVYLYTLLLPVTGLGWEWILRLNNEKKQIN